MGKIHYYNNIYLLLVALALSFFSACGQRKAKDGRTDTPTSGKIGFVADESFSPVIEEEREQFQFEYPKAQLEPLYTDETTGFQMLKDLKTCLFITSRGLTDSEKAYFKTKRITPASFPIGYDGLAFIVNRANNDTCITVKDIKRILMGEATNWNQIVEGSTRGEIELVFDNNNSATMHFVVDSILDGKNIGAKNVYAAKASKDVVDYVEQTENAIGVIGSNWLNDKRDSTNLTFKKDIHVMSVTVADKATPSNSWKPYQAYLLDERYPFVRTIYCNVVDPHRALPWSFANYISNPRGQLIMLKTGLLPYRGDIILKKVEIND